MFGRFLVWFWLLRLYLASRLGALSFLTPLFGVLLLEGSTAKGEKRLLLQIFSQTLLGPVFFECIQRKADEGFGEGNCKALFESLERDQIRQGTIQVGTEGVRPSGQLGQSSRISV